MIRFDFLNWFQRMAEKAAQILPDWMTGKSDIMKKKYHMKYGCCEYDRFIKQNKIRIMTAYLLSASVFSLISLFTFAMQMTEGENEITSIKRPAYSETVKKVPVEVRMKYGDYEFTKNITVAVRQKELTVREKRKLLHDYKIQLSNTILAGNKALDHISKPLNLIGSDPASGITIDWTSSRPDLVSVQGDVDLIGAEDNENVVLQAIMTYEDVSITGEYRLKLDTGAANEDFERSLAGRLDENLKMITKPGKSSRINLPADLGNGVEIRWFTAKESNGFLLTMAFLFAVLMIFFKRYDRIDKEIKEAEESVIKDLPEFINKLVLLLNAGLVVSTAFEKIVADYESFYKTDKKKTERFLYEQLSVIQKKVNQSNASLIRELREFSKRCGVREMVRLTAVIADNWNKGSMLAEKLQGESELLWISRKKKAEEKGKLAETKLTFPLMILLIVLIMVTVAPAMMEM